MDAKETALKALARREMTGEEVRRLLARKGANEQEAASVVADLTRLGLVDDARTAATVVERVQASPGKGSGAARTALARRGVSPEAAEPALAPLDADSDLAKARAFVASRSWKNAGQAARALLSRGFEEECVRRVVEEAFPED